MADRSDYDAMIALDRTVSPEVRVRLWDHASDDAVVGATTAHTGVEVTWIEEGHATYRIGATPIEVQRGHAMVVPAWVEHATSFGRFRSATVYLREDTIEQVADAVGPSMRGRTLAPGLVRNPARVAALARLLLDEARGPGPGEDLAASALAEALAIELLRHDARPATSQRALDPRIRRAVEAIRERYDHPLSIADLARAASMSPHHFGRLFREQVGKSPYRYVLDVRLAHAATLLRTGRCSVIEAALAAGFTDLGRFHRMFRARWGCSPGEFRRDAT
ncbi:Transcriptional regulator, AraC family protein [Minicystis rosea]|nr:Transcriptional regulator, AraC family protein [Minicystis rosea]